MVNQNFFLNRITDISSKTVFTQLILREMDIDISINGSDQDYLQIKFQLIESTVQS
jgi:hypothetical protein